MGRGKATGRFDTRAELCAFIWREYQDTPRKLVDIAAHARVSIAIAHKIINTKEGMPMVNKVTLSQIHDAERRLAELKGYREIFRLKVDGVEVGGLHYNKSTFTGGEQVPRWCRDWAQCGPLMVEHAVYPEENGTGSICFPMLIKTYGSKAPCVLIADFATKSDAVMYAIVQAAIFVLEQRHG